MRESWRAYRKALWNHSKGLISGAIFGALGVALSIHPVALPAWFWFLLALGSLFWVGFLAFHDVRVERDGAAAVIKELTTSPSLSASDVRIEESPNDGKPLLRLALHNASDKDVPAGRLLNILYPASWTTFEGCNAEGLFLVGGPSVNSDEPLPEDIPAKLWPHALPDIGPRVTLLLHFRVRGPEGQHALIVRAAGLNDTHSVELTEGAETPAIAPGPSSLPQLAPGGRNVADEMQKVLLVRGAISDGKAIVARAINATTTSETVDLGDWDAHHHSLSLIPGAKDAYDRSREVVARFRHYNQHVTVQNTYMPPEDHQETVRYAGMAERALDVVYQRLEKERPDA